MLRKIILSFIGIVICVILVWTIFVMLVKAEVVKPTWMKKSKHVILHKHKDYQVKQVIFKWTPMIGDSRLFGYGLNTDEVKEYSE